MTIVPPSGHCDKRLQIMQAAERLFVRGRLHEITMDDVAQAAGVGKGTLYRYFQDKDDLFFATATAGMDEVCALIRQCDGQAAFPQELLEVCRHVSGFFRRRRQLMQMIQNEEGRVDIRVGVMREKWLERRKQLVAALADVLQKGVREGALRQDVPPEILSSFLLGMLRTRARDLADVSEPYQGLELVVDLFCRGAGLADPPART